MGVQRLGNVSQGYARVALLQDFGDDLRFPLNLDQSALDGFKPVGRGRVHLTHRLLVRQRQLRAFADLIPLKVGQHRQHLEDHAPRRRGGVDLLGQAHQVSALLVQLLADVQHVACASRQATDGVADQRHAFAGGFQRRFQTLPALHAGPTQSGVFKHCNQLGIVQITPGANLGPLRFQAHPFVGLALGTDSDVTDGFLHFATPALAACLGVRVSISIYGKAINRPASGQRHAVEAPHLGQLCIQRLGQRQQLRPVSTLPGVA